MKNLTLLYLCLSFALISCDEESICLIGSGHTRNYPLSVASFTEVTLLGPVNLNIRQGDVSSVEVIAEPEMMAELDYQVHDGELEIGYQGNVSCFETVHGVWIEITVPTVDRINVFGVSEIKSVGDLYLDHLVLDINGVGNVELSGEVQNQSIRVDGSASIHNLALQSSTTSIKVRGSAEIEVAVSDQLNIDLEGSASITYEGSPSINKDVEGNLELLNN